MRLMREARPSMRGVAAGQSWNCNWEGSRSGPIELSLTESYDDRCNLSSEA